MWIPHKQVVMQSVTLSPLRLGEIDMHVIDASPPCRFKGQPFCSLLGQLSFAHVPLCGSWTYDWAVVQMWQLGPAGHLFIATSRKQSSILLQTDIFPSSHRFINMFCTMTVYNLWLHQAVSSAQLAQFPHLMTIFYSLVNDLSQMQCF